MTVYSTVYLNFYELSLARWQPNLIEFRASVPRHTRALVRYNGTHVTGRYPKLIFMYIVSQSNNVRLCLEIWSIDMFQQLVIPLIRVTNLDRRALYCFWGNPNNSFSFPIARPTQFCGKVKKTNKQTNKQTKNKKTNTLSDKQNFHF